VLVRQSFGNCPQYIQRRVIVRANTVASPARELSSLDSEARSLIEHADTFFVASRSRADVGRAGGADISHRGGRPGFVGIEGDTLLIPDFRGNRYFNTLGNLSVEPRASLLFVDFEAGDLLQLQGMAEVDWNAEAAEQLAGAERLWRFHVHRGWRRKAASPLRWEFVDYSRATLNIPAEGPGRRAARV
jgi:hypothetical protein